MILTPRSMISIPRDTKTRSLTILMSHGNRIAAGPVSTAGTGSGSAP